MALRPVLDGVDTGMPGTVGAAEKSSRMLDAMTNDLAPAMGTGRGQCVDRAFKGIKSVRPAIHCYRKRFVIVVSAYIALGHGRDSCLSCTDVDTVGRTDHNV